MSLLTSRAAKYFIIQMLPHCLRFNVLSKNLYKINSQKNVIIEAEQQVTDLLLLCIQTSFYSADIWRTNYY